MGFLKEILDMLIDNLEKYKRLNQKKKEEPSVREFRKIQAVFNTIHHIEEKHDESVGFFTEVVYEVLD